MRRVAVSAVCLAALCFGCLSLSPPEAPSEDAFTRGRALVDLDYLAQVRAHADANPEDLRAQWKAGLAHARASLQGHLDQRDAAERYLERAWVLDPRSQTVPVGRVLGRYLNMRRVVLDTRKLDLQQRVYASLLASRTDSMAAIDPVERLHVHGFVTTGEALRQYVDGDTLAALATLQALEATVDDWLAEHPDDIDTHAMAGNFEITFAGLIPVGRARRLRAGIEHLAIQQDRWDEMSPHARDPNTAPNVRSVFALYLAEGLLAAGEIERADRRYRELIALDDQRDTAPRRQIVALARHRLANLEAYAGADELIPPWPTGVVGCVACHGREAELPTGDLFVLESLE